MSKDKNANMPWICDEEKTNQKKKTDQKIKVGQRQFANEQKSKRRRNKANQVIVLDTFHVLCVWERT